MSTADDTFLKQFGLILVLLFFFTIAMVILANSIGGPAMSESRNSPSAVASRIAKVGSVRFDGDAPAKPVEVAVAVAPAGAARGGEEIYNLACVACHASGAAGAPMVGDKAAWEPRIAQDMDTLVGHAINGKGAMPARGGIVSLTDDEVRNAVVYMLDETGIAAADSAEAPAAAPATATATATATAAAPAAAETTAAAEVPKAEMAAVPAPAAEAATPAAAEVVAEAAPEAVQTAAAGKPGEEVYSMGCMACHVSGAAGAPKTGDDAAWASRYQQGLDALVHNAINGKGVMPAKGGLTFLEDADVHNAVVFMLQESGITP